MDAIIATSKSGASFLESDAHISYHGVNTDRFYPSNKTANNRIGFLSRIRKQKGAEDFVDAAIKVLPQHPSWTAELYGETTKDNVKFQEDLENRIKKANLQNRIIFKGFVSYDKTPDIYRNLDIVVCASHVEGFGLPCLEAMASRCAVVATKTGVWKEIIKNSENGFLADCKSSEQIAQGLNSLLKDNELREKCAENGYQLMQSKFKIENETKEIQKVYDKLLGANNV